MRYSTKHQRSILWAVNIGTTLEWYELSLYAYWAPTISKIFFNGTDEVSNLLNVFIFLALGYLIRPLGGIFFGRLGDRIGRRKALVWSIITMTIPTLIMGFLPAYSSVGILAPILLCINRLLQSFPAGGELPGSFCYLYESASIENRKYLTSWGFMGNQVGIILAMVECLLFESFLSHEQIITWGWRFSFLIGSLIGFYGFYLRHKLRETPVWERLEETHSIVKHPISTVLLTHKWKILKGIGYSAIPSVSFGALTTFFPTYFENLLNTDYLNSLFILIGILILITVPLPFFGYLADRYDYKKMLIYSTLTVLVLSVLFTSLNFSLLISALVFILIALAFACIYALLPFILTDLFPAPLRFTGIGLTFNIADSFEGFTPAAALFLMHLPESHTSFFWITIVCTLISLTTYCFIPTQKGSKKLS